MIKAETITADNDAASSWLAPYRGVATPVTVSLVVVIVAAAISGVIIFVNSHHTPNVSAATLTSVPYQPTSDLQVSPLNGAGQAAATGAGSQVSSQATTAPLQSSADSQAETNQTSAPATSQLSGLTGNVSPNTANRATAPSLQGSSSNSTNN